MSMSKSTYGFILLLGAYAMAGKPTSLKIVQAFVRSPDVVLFLSISDEHGDPFQVLEKHRFKLKIDGKIEEKFHINQFSPPTEAIDYLFLVDISMSIKTEFSVIRECLLDWVENIKDKDRAGLYVIGDEVDLVHSFGDEREELKNLVSKLNPSSAKTNLYQGISESLKWINTVGADLPNRRAVILISDGQDDLGKYSPADVNGELGKSDVPFYAIVLKDSEAKFYDIKNFANSSGGKFCYAKNDLKAACASVKADIVNVWRLETEHSDCICVKDGGSHELIVSVDKAEHNRVVRFPSRSSIGKHSPNPWYINLINTIGWLLPFFFLANIRLKRLGTGHGQGKAGGSSTETDLPHDMGKNTSDNYPDDNTKSESGAKSTIYSNRFELLCVKGHELSKSIWTIKSTLTLGRKSCDITILGEGVSLEHCKMLAIGSHIIISNEVSRSRTLLNGIPIHGRSKLSDNDFIQIGDSVYKFNFC